MMEEIRKQDPSYLTSSTIMLGSLINKGQALVIDRKHPRETSVESIGGSDAANHGRMKPPN